MPFVNFSALSGKIDVRSGPQVRSARIIFNQPTVLEPDDFEIRPTAKTVTVVSGKQPNPRHLVHVTLTKVSEIEYLLGFDLRGYDGVYDVVLVTYGNETVITTFHQLLGDFDGDGQFTTSETDDYAAVVGSIDKAAGDAGFRWELDFNGDNFVDATDLYRPSGVNDTLGTAWTY